LVKEIFFVADLLVYFVLTPILIAVFMYLFSHAALGRLLAVLLQLGLVIGSFLLFIYVNSAYETVTVNIGNYRSVLGISLGADYISSLFVLLTNFIFLMCTIYSYKENDNKLFWFLMFVWQAAIVGIFLTRDLFNRFVLMEVGTMIITILMVYRRGDRKMFHAMIFLMINIVAVQFYIFGMGLVYMQTGVLDLYLAAERLRHIDTNYLLLPYALFMTFVAFKAALLPMSHWLPKTLSASGAPSSASAVLAGINVTSGLYMFIRFSYMFNMINIAPFFIAVGLITSVFAIIMAISHKDIKTILSYLTLSQVGLIIAAFNLGDVSYHGALFHTLNQIVFHGALFFASGIIIHMYNTRDIHEIRGLFKTNKTAAIVTIVGLLGLTGIPFFNGNLGIYLMFSYAPMYIRIIVWIINFGVIIVAIRYISMLFDKPRGEIIKESDIEKRIASILLAALCLFLGLFGSYLVNIIFDIDVNVFDTLYLLNAGILAASLIVGIFIFRKDFKNEKVTNIARDLDVGFKGMAISIGIFFAGILIAAYLLT